MKRYFLFAAAAVLAAVFVYAYAVDTDGGYNVWEKGTCTWYHNTTNTSYTDYCHDIDSLQEYYPNASICYSAWVDCTDFNVYDNQTGWTKYECKRGKCKQKLTDPLS
ncbi:MAG: hypothetical protein KJ709_00100 [Nanoarchaeota archaeon]|nr:hypothetical protein [Nanoarchaeota archaeon]